MGQEVVVISRCLSWSGGNSSSMEGGGDFHFQGFFRGQKINLLHLTSSFYNIKRSIERYCDYLIQVEVEQITSKGILNGKIKAIRKIE